VKETDMPKGTLTFKALDALNDFDEWVNTQFDECENPELPDCGDISDEDRYDRELRILEAKKRAAKAKALAG
jgi:hypothetical protein